MSTTIRCPVCDARVKLAEEPTAGESVVCSACEERFVPNQPRAKTEEPKAPDGDTYATKEPEGREAPRERDDGYDSDRRRKRSRTRRSDRDDDDDYRREANDVAVNKIWATVGLGFGILIILGALVSVSSPGRGIPGYIYFKALVMGGVGVGICGTCFRYLAMNSSSSRRNTRNRHRF